MRTSSIFFSSSSLTLLALFYFFHISAAQNFIQSTCRTSSNEDPNVPYGFCTTSLQAAPASRCASVRGLGSISIRLARFNLTDTRCYIKHLLKNKKVTNTYVRAALKDCFQLYSDAIPSIKEAMESYSAKRYLDANFQVSAVMDAATTCEDGFTERKGVVSPLTKRNNDTFKLSAIVLSIMHILEPGSN